MERKVDIKEISDGRLYQITDLVKIGCSDCKGCSKCCEHMDGLITLDPYDLYRIGSEFDKLIGSYVDFTVDRGLMIPVLKMDEASGRCRYLSESGRCSIHDKRPGICRLFPMGRLYEEGSFSYFLQKDECDYPEKTKVKLKNWIDTPEINKYEQYICDWHYFTRDLQEYMNKAEDSEIKQINSIIIQIFYARAYGDGFYGDFYERLNKVKSLL